MKEPKYIRDWRNNKPLAATYLWNELPQNILRVNGDVIETPAYCINASINATRKEMKSFFKWLECVMRGKHPFFSRISIPFQFRYLYCYRVEWVNIGAREVRIGCQVFKWGEIYRIGRKLGWTKKQKAAV